MMKVTRSRGAFGNTPVWPLHYRTGMWAWVLQRITGVAITVYLFVHIWVISFSATSDGGMDFDRVLARLQEPFFIVLDIALLAAVAYHALNGIRILIFDLGEGIRVQKIWFWSLMAIVVVIVVLGTVYLIPFILGKSLT